jgi:hypothetical protein
MPKAKRFSPRKPRSAPVSTNPETARIREIEQSRRGFDVERARVKTKYRTRLARAKARLTKASDWDKITLEEKQSRLDQVQLALAAAEEDELQNMAHDWYKIAYASESEESPTMIEDMNEGDGSEWIDSSDFDEDDMKPVDYVLEGRDTNENEPDESDPDFEEGDVDISDNEELVNGTDIEEGFQAIMNKHMKHLHKQLDIIAEMETEEGVIVEDKVG